jgi:DNA-binding CsgD family transcriptional regulator
MTRARGRGGRGGAEPRGRIQNREQSVLEHHLKGATQQEIAAALTISQPAVSKILRRIEERFLRDQQAVIGRVKARHTLVLNHVIAEATRAWHASKTPEPRRRQRRTDGGSGHTQTVAEIVSEPRHGDPRYLGEARAAMADIRKIWGLDAPQQIQMDAKRPFMHLTPEELEAEVRQRNALLLAEGPLAVAATTPPTTTRPGEPAVAPVLPTMTGGGPDV